MVPLYEYVHEIQKATGWSQGRISIESGLHLSTVNRLFRLPVYNGNQTSKKLITQLHREVVPTPFPEYLEQLFHVYDILKERLSKREFMDYQNTVEALLKHQHSLTGLAGCRIYWLLGHIEFDRAFYFKQAAGARAQQALYWYQQALALLDTYAQPSVQIYKYKLQQCIVSTQFNSYPPQQRADNEAIRHWLIALDYLEVVKIVIQEERWNWGAARNGLIAASILHDFEACWFFWQALNQVSQRFADLNFVPACDLPALSQDGDVTWFVEQIKEGMMSTFKEAN